MLLGVLSEPNISPFNFEAADSDIGEATSEFSITDNNEDASMDIRIDPEELNSLCTLMFSMIWRDVLVSLKSSLPSDNHF